MIEYTVKVDKNGNRFWCKEDGWLHREDGPAIEDSNGTKVWFINGVRHRKDGPAVEYSDGTKKWYINGKKLTEEEFNKRTQKEKLTVAEISQLLGYDVEIIKE